MYLTCLPLCGVFLLGAGYAPTFAGVAVLRFLAGFFGGPCLVLIEGTFADIWSAKTTNTYYAFLGTAQFFGAALGALIGGYVVDWSGGWRWTQYFSAILCGVVWLFGFGISESYQREIPRRRAKHQGTVLKQDSALSGVKFSEMFRITVLDPIRQTFAEPLVMLSTLFLIFNFALVMQWFITVPVALGSPPPAGPGYSITQVGLAFTTAIAGSVLAVLMVVGIEQALIRTVSDKDASGSIMIEYRLVPAMVGPLLVTAALFWIGKMQVGS